MISVEALEGGTLRRQQMFAGVTSEQVAELAPPLPNERASRI
jgi:hypothetical protein